MNNFPPEIAIIVDPEFGERLGALAAEQVVWVTDSATNRAAAERLWRVPLAHAMTTFRFDETVSRPATFAAILPVVNEHHGGASCVPPYQRLTVYGARPNATVRAALTAIGFELEGVTADGFTARRAA